MTDRWQYLWQCNKCLFIVRFVNMSDGKTVISEQTHTHRLICPGQSSVNTVINTPRFQTPSTCHWAFSAVLSTDSWCGFISLPSTSFPLSLPLSLIIVHCSVAAPLSTFIKPHDLTYWFSRHCFSLLPLSTIYFSLLAVFRHDLSHNPQHRGNGDSLPFGKCRTQSPKKLP